MMAELPRWTSQRVAKLRQEQEKEQEQPPPQPQEKEPISKLQNGTTNRSASSSRWAPVSSISTQHIPFSQTKPSSSSSSSSSTGFSKTNHTNTGLSPSSSISQHGLRVRDPMKQLGAKLDAMSLLTSPSRGLDSSPSQTDLTNLLIQEQFRKYISDQLSQRFSQRQQPLLSANHSDPRSLLTKSGETALDEILLLVRKLREGCVASSRPCDLFTLDVYLLSVYLSLLCLNVPQLSTTLPRLLSLSLTLTTTTSIDIQWNQLQAIKDVSILVVPFSESLSHLQSLSLLEPLCLFSFSSRLGGQTQHQNLESGFSSFLSLQQQQQQKDSISTNVYQILRDCNCFSLSHLVQNKELSIWQRILIVSLVPVFRKTVWSILKKSYLTLAIPNQVVALLFESSSLSPPPAMMKEKKEEEEDTWLFDLLLFEKDSSKQLIEFLSCQPEFDSRQCILERLVQSLSGTWSIRLR